MRSVNRCAGTTGTDETGKTTSDADGAAEVSFDALLKRMVCMKTLSIDLETFSSNDLHKCGVYKYAEAPDFEILLFGYSVDSGPVEVVDLACGEDIPQDILDALTDDSVTKWAFNSQFERICLSRYLRDKFVENIVQAISRDTLMYAMKTLRCCSIVAHVHDELIIEADKRMSLDTVCEQMGRTPPWAEGLLLRADGYETDFYKKD